LISLLTRPDRHMALSYLKRDPLHNIYLIHGLETYGLACDNMTFWGAFSDQQLEGALYIEESKARTAYLAGDDPTVLSRLGQLAYQAGAGTLFGKKAYVQPALAHLGARVRVTTRRLHFYRADPGRLVRHYDYPVRMATDKDIPALVELYREYEFAGKKRPDDEIEHAIVEAMTLSGVYFVLEREGRIVTAARVFPQTDQAGMVGAARTLPEFRGRGMYLSIRTACFEHLFDQDKIGLGLFVDTNSSMQRVLDKQGGLILSEWLIARLRAVPPLRRRVLPLDLRHWILGIRDCILRIQGKATKGRNNG
jgi:hypothetical protein